MLCTAQGLTEGLQFKLSRSSCMPPCCSPCGWRWWRTVNALPPIGRWSVGQTPPTFQEPPDLCLCRQGGQMHLEGKGQRISQLQHSTCPKWDKHGTGGRKLWLLTWRLQQRQESNSGCYLSDNRADLILDRLNGFVSGGTGEHKNGITCNI